jgi:hypothetical protein
VTYGGYVYTKDVDGNFVRQPEEGKFREASWLRSWHAVCLAAGNLSSGHRAG